MVNIKICGIRRQEDVKYLNKYLPQYAGFIFAESKRRVSLGEARRLIGNLDRRINAVGVFVNENIEKIIETCNECCLKVIQLHGDESSEYLCRLRQAINEKCLKSKMKYDIYNAQGNIQIWKAFRVHQQFLIENIAGFNADAYLLDTYTKGSYGGTGEAFDWDVALRAKEYGRIILAGGLNPANAAKAAEYVQPFALDVSSGVETDGYKDEEKIRQFMQEAR